LTMLFCGFIIKESLKRVYTVIHLGNIGLYKN
jgi:hypothetical protein